MATNYVSSGDDITITSGGAVVAGDVVLVGSTGLWGVAHNAAAGSGETVVLRTKGVFDLTKQTAVAVTAGDKIYWDNAAKEADKTNTNVFIGHAIQDAAGGDATVRVRLANAGA